MFRLIHIHPIHFIVAVSKALELSSVGISQHHHRTNIIARHIGLQMGLSKEQLDLLMLSSLLHDIGAASNWQEKHWIMHKDDDDLVFHHAEAGYNILIQLNQFEIIAEVIRHHHDRFCGGNPGGLKGEQIPLLSRILHVADRIEVQIDPAKHIFEQRNGIMEMLESSKYFDPAVIDAVRKLNHSDYFWLDVMNTKFLNRFMDEYTTMIGAMRFDFHDLISIAEVFSRVTDSTSPYTAAHSGNVAKVAGKLAAIEGFGSHEAELFYLAGLLHDIGKLAIPNEILMKPEPLTQSEMDLIHQHPYYSFTILNEIEGFGEIALWVGQHHEKLNGSGYPFGLNVSQLTLGSKILAVSDIFSALLEKRPYRSGMSIENAIESMELMVKENEIDGKLVTDLKENIADIVPLINRNISIRP